jgi:hypothetical protein
VFTVTSGRCTVSADRGLCLRSPNYPANYDFYDACKAAVTPSQNIILSVTAFDTEPGYDYLDLGNGQSRFSGSNPIGLQGAVVPAGGIITFTSDNLHTRTGFEICGMKPANRQRLFASAA